MFQFFAIKAGTTYGNGITDFDDTLADGVLGMYDQNGTLIPLGVALSPTCEKVTIGLGRPTGETQKISSIINRDGNISYSYQAYVAPQKRVVEIGQNTVPGTGSLNLPTTFAVGDSMGVWITDKSIPVENPTRSKYWEVVATPGTANMQAMLTALILKIHTAYTLGNCPVDAVVVGAQLGITFTAANYNSDFEVKPAGLIAYADYTAVIAHIQEEGGYTQLLDLQKRSSVEDGNRNAYNETVGSFVQSSELVSGVNYDQIVINVINPEQRDFQMGNGLTLQIILAIPTTLNATLTAPLIANIIANL